MPVAMPRVVRSALACALLLALTGDAEAASRHLPLTDDGGRAWRAGSGIVAEAMRFLGAGNVSGTRGPWCADYASMVLRRTGHRPLANRMAGAALGYGPHVRDPRPGDLVVLGGRHGASHVGFFAGWSRGAVVIVSGNWSHRVARGMVSARAVIAFVRT